MRDIEDEVFDKIFLEEIAQQAKLTKLEKELFDYYIHGYSHQDFADDTGRNRNAGSALYQHMLKKLKKVVGLFPEEKVTSKYDRKRLQELWSKGLSIVQIEELTGLENRIIDSLLGDDVDTKSRRYKTLGSYNEVYKAVNREMQIPRRCAICGKITSGMKFTLCYRCYKKWGIEPEWVQALLSIEQREHDLDQKAASFTFTDADLDFNGEEIYEEERSK
jgi:hypothetical protein